MSSRSTFSHDLAHVAAGALIGLILSLGAVAIYLAAPTRGGEWDAISLLGTLTLVVTTASAWAAWNASVSAKAQAAAARMQVQASLLDHRMDIYDAVQEFMKPWYQNGYPDLTKLYLIVKAWERSHFVFDPRATTYLRQLWLDAVDSEYAHKIITREYEGDRDAAIKKQYDLLRKYSPDIKEGQPREMAAFELMKMDSWSD